MASREMRMDSSSGESFGGPLAISSGLQEVAHLGRVGRHLYQQPTQQRATNRVNPGVSGRPDSEA